MNDALAIKISQAMAEQKLSVREAARRCSIDFGRLTAILYGRTQRPHPETLQSIADGLGLTYRELALAAYGVIADPMPAAAAG